MGLSVVLALLLPCGLARTANPDRYPPQVLAMTGGKSPFQPAGIAMPHEFALVPMRDVARGGTYAAAIRMTVEPVGERLLLLDTAAAGLLLKEPLGRAIEAIHVPEWAGRGPGIRTGKFAILERLWSRELALEPAVAELFDGKGFPWVDGILSTWVFGAWVVRLDFRKQRLLLLPFGGTGSSAGREWPCRLESNWWIAEVSVDGRPARMLLDSGTPRSYLAEAWLRSESRGKAGARKSAVSGSDGYFEAGVREIRIPGAGRYRLACLGAVAARTPSTAEGMLDGVLGYDFLGKLHIELDYRAAKVRIPEAFGGR